MSHCVYQLLLKAKLGVVLACFITIQLSFAGGIPYYVHLNNETTGTSDVVAFYFQDGATTAFDSQYDAHKFLPNLEYLATISSDSFELSINAIPQQSQEVPIKLTLITVGTFSFSFNNVFIQDPDVSLYLLDKSNGSLTDLRNVDYYPFIVSDTLSKDANRFSIVIDVQEGAKTTVITSLDDYQSKGININEVIVYNRQGKMLFQSHKEIDIQTIDGIEGQFIFVRMFIESGEVIESKYIYTGERWLKG